MRRSLDNGVFIDNKAMALSAFLQEIPTQMYTDSTSRAVFLDLFSDARAGLPRDASECVHLRAMLERTISSQSAATDPSQPSLLATWYSVLRLCFPVHRLARQDRDPRLCQTCGREFQDTPAVCAPCRQKAALVAATRDLSVLLGSMQSLASSVKQVLLDSFVTFLEFMPALYPSIQALTNQIAGMQTETLPPPLPLPMLPLLPRPVLLRPRVRNRLWNWNSSPSPLTLAVKKRTMRRSMVRSQAPVRPHIEVNEAEPVSSSESDIQVVCTNAPEPEDQHQPPGNEQAAETKTHVQVPLAVKKLKTKRGKRKVRFQTPPEEPPRCKPQIDPTHQDKAQSPDEVPANKAQDQASAPPENAPPSSEAPDTDDHQQVRPQTDPTHEDVEESKAPATEAQDQAEHKPTSQTKVASLVETTPPEEPLTNEVQAVLVPRAEKTEAKSEDKAQEGTEVCALVRVKTKRSRRKKSKHETQDDTENDYLLEMATEWITGNPALRLASLRHQNDFIRKLNDAASNSLVRRSCHQLTPSQAQTLATFSFFKLALCTSDLLQSENFHMVWASWCSLRLEQQKYLLSKWSRSVAESVRLVVLDVASGFDFARAKQDMFATSDCVVFCPHAVAEPQLVSSLYAQQSWCEHATCPLRILLSLVARAPAACLNPFLSDLVVNPVLGLALGFNFPDQVCLFFCFSFRNSLHWLRRYGLGPREGRRAQETQMRPRGKVLRSRPD